MTIRECISDALKSLGESGLAGKIEVGQTSEAGELFSMAKSVISEICADYFPLKITEEAVFDDNGELLFSQLNYTAADVFSVKKEGKAYPFEIKYDRIESPVTGAAAVEYSIIPALNLDGELPFPAVISGRTVALGIAAEFCIANGYDAANTFDKKYRDALKRALFTAPLSKKEKRVKIRVWA